MTIEVNDLNINKKNLEQEVDSFQIKIKNFEEREKLYLETENIQGKFPRHRRQNLRYYSVSKGIKKFGGP